MPDSRTIQTIKSVLVKSVALAKVFLVLFTRKNAAVTRTKIIGRISVYEFHFLNDVLSMLSFTAPKKKKIQRMKKRKTVDRSYDFISN